MNKQEALENVIKNPMSAEAWQECGKACGWGDKSIIGSIIPKWQYVAFRFHEINLTQGFEEAVDWLEELIK